MRRIALTMATVVAVVGVVTPALANTQTQPQPSWGTCPVVAGSVPDPRQQCTTIQVPLDYQHPDGRHVPVAVSRIRTAKPGVRRGVLLLIPGGPGNSGLNRPTTYGLRLPPEVLDRYDIVGFDPRGVGQSTPVTCALSATDADPRQFLPWPDTDGGIIGNVDHARRVAQACARNGGDLMRYITTRNEARDIDRIRRSLGESRLSYWGVSYGTYAGAVYATMFPGRTDRVVLDSSDDPDPTRVARGWVNNFAVGAEDRFPDFAAWAASRDTTFGLGTTPTAVRATYLRLAGALDRSPLPDLSGNDLRANMFNALYTDASFPLLAQLMHAALTSTPLPTVPLPPPDQFQNLLAVQTATGCNDVAWPRAIQSYAAAVAGNRVAYPLTAGMPANIYPCAFWPYPPAESPTRITSSGPSNILMIQNRRDPATPYSAALRMRAALGGRARLVSVDSGGHGAYLANGNACGDRTVTAFLADGVRPGRDLTCAS